MRLSWLVRTETDLACALSMLAQDTEKEFGPQNVRGPNKVVKAARGHDD